MLDLMLFRGPLPFLTKPGFAAVNALVVLNITRSWYVLLFIMDSLMRTDFNKFANTFLISFPSKNSDLSLILET